MAIPLPAPPFILSLSKDIPSPSMGEGWVRVTRPFALSLSLRGAQQRGNLVGYQTGFTAQAGIHRLPSPEQRQRNLYMQIPGTYHAGDFSPFAPGEVGKFCPFPPASAEYRLGYSMANPS